MALDPTRIFIHIHPNLEKHPNIQKFSEDFESYKKQAFDYAKDANCNASAFLPTLTEEDQQNLPPDQSLFGRDRVFYKRQAANDPLYHVHIFKPNDKDCIWHEEDGVHYSQWQCTSDAALIYAHMDNDSEDFHFLLLEIVDPGAHEKYKEDGAIEYWRKLVVAFRAINKI